MAEQNKPTGENTTQADILLEYYRSNQNRDIKHPEIVDWVTAEYLKRTGKIFRDPDRGIRKLFQDGYLRKVKKGVYRYDPEYVENRELEDFSPALREQIFKRDNYKCVMCGRGRKEGVEIHADHIKPKDLGGRATLINGQTLCGQHNNLKKNFKQTETGKKMFMSLYGVAKSENAQDLMQFCADVLEVYDKHNMNSHIKWTK